MKINKSRTDRGLGKYDAPLRVQYQMGYAAFKNGNNLTSPLNKDTMQHREWERGFNKAYFDQLKRVKEYEETTGRSRSVPEGDVQHV
tara:strand:+ start:262 stop:522 length:261 start_codon:yes stop_codon:yes gene_type:complete